MIHLPELSDDDPHWFPDVHQALDEPNGLLAVGGDLSVTRLLSAYRRGIFPWYVQGEPVLWWSPDPRAVFLTDRAHVSRRLARWLGQCQWSLTADRAFNEVLRACAAPRAGQHPSGTWITRDMKRAYLRLHEAGFAHSIEAWDGERLVGGLYGVGIGGMFFGESMFSHASNGSKVVLLALCRAMALAGMPWLDAQVPSAHLTSLGAVSMPRHVLHRGVRQLVTRAPPTGSWHGRLAAITPAELARAHGAS